MAAHPKTLVPTPEIPKNLVTTPEKILFAGGKIGAGLAAVTAAGWTEAKLTHMPDTKYAPAVSYSVQYLQLHIWL